MVARDKSWQQSDGVGVTRGPAQGYSAMGEVAADGATCQAETYVMGPAIWPVYGCLSKMCGMAMTCHSSIGLLVPHKPMNQIKIDKFRQCAPSKP